MPVPKNAFIVLTLTLVFANFCKSEIISLNLQITRSQNAAEKNFVNFLLTETSEERKTSSCKLNLNEHVRLFANKKMIDLHAKNAMYAPEKQEPYKKAAQKFEKENRKEIERGKRVFVFSSSDSLKITEISNVLSGEIFSYAKLTETPENLKKELPGFFVKKSQLKKQAESLKNTVLPVLARSYKILGDNENEDEYENENEDEILHEINEEKDGLEQTLQNLSQKSRPFVFSLNEEFFNTFASKAAQDSLKIDLKIEVETSDKNCNPEISSGEIEGSKILFISCALPKEPDFFERSVETQNLRHQNKETLEDVQEKDKKLAGTKSVDSGRGFSSG